MSNNIPNSAIGAVASVISEYYFNHSKLNTLFMESGAPGEVPEGNCEAKCSAWLKRCNDHPSVNALEVLGAVIREYMDEKPPPSLFGGRAEDPLEEGKTRIINALSKNQLSYQTNGYIALAGSHLTTKTLDDYLNSGDFSSIEKEFVRALEHIDTDPHAAITAASSIIEAALKVYIETFGLRLPKKSTIMPLWATVQLHLDLNADQMLRDDQLKMLRGISSIIDGVGAFRSHIGSVHGRGIAPPIVVVAEARLAVNVSNAIVIFLMELLHAKND